MRAKRERTGAPDWLDLHADWHVLMLRASSETAFLEQQEGVRGTPQMPVRTLVISRKRRASAMQLLVVDIVRAQRGADARGERALEALLASAQSERNRSRGGGRFYQRTSLASP